MELDLHADLRIQKLTLGAERAPLLVIDQLVADPEDLVARAVDKPFGGSTRHFPGIRARAPLSYQQLIAERLGPLFLEHFGLGGRSLRFTMCHYSLVTTPPQALAAIQCIPHVDSLGSSGLASIHYLFKRDLGGTAFYRHRKTGFEFVDESRKEIYFGSLARESDAPGGSRPGYINGDTPQFEQIAKQDGLFNRMLVYRRNSLHSGCIARDFVPDPNPLTGRLSINSFMDPAL